MSQSVTPSLRRVAMMAAGILFIGLGVGAYRISGLGVDAFTCMNLSISSCLGLSFGSWQLLMNAAILLVMLFTVRQCIGPGTIVNMVGVGYLADLLCWLARELLPLEMTLPLRAGALVLGSLLAGLGVALYLTAELGVAPYDSVAVIIQTLSRHRVPFRLARVASDVTVVAVGVAVCLLFGGRLWDILGVGTVCNALLNGPLIQFFRARVAEPILRGESR